MLLYFKLCYDSNFADSIPTAEHSEKFVEASKNGNLIPLYRCIFSDHLTPVLAYRCLVKEDDRDAPSFLFESVEPGLQVSSVVSPFLRLVFPFVFSFFVLFSLFPLIYYLLVIFRLIY